MLGEGGNSVFIFLTAVSVLLNALESGSSCLE